MDFISILTAILTLLAGIGVFLVACTMMSSNLESAASRRLKQLFSHTGNNKLIGVGIGTLGTAAIQSSGAVTVMVIGFVNVGIMSLTQAATIIYGANIGTTVTAQLVALGLSGSNSLSTTVLFAAFAGIGAFMMLFAKSDAWKDRRYPYRLRNALCRSQYDGECHGRVRGTRLRQTLPRLHP